MYESLADIYDKSIGFDHEGYFAFVAPYLKGEGLDLACGSGRFTALAVAAGHKMTGVDSSVEMLSKAAQRGGAEWVCADISALRIPENTYGFISCVCDGFNYLPPRALTRTLNNIYAALNAGGALIFDVSTPYKLEKVLGGSLPIEELNEYLHTYVKNLPSGEKSRLEIANSIWFRADEGLLQVNSEFLQKNADYYNAAAYRARQIGHAARNLSIPAKRRFYFIAFYPCHYRNNFCRHSAFQALTYRLKILGFNCKKDVLAVFNKILVICSSHNAEFCGAIKRFVINIACHNLFCAKEIRRNYAFKY